MATWNSGASAIEDPHGGLERALIDEYLAEHGQTLHSVSMLPAEHQRQLLSAATAYATLRLTEIESRARYVEDLNKD
jgi:hypothetical protein